MLLVVGKISRRLDVQFSGHGSITQGVPFNTVCPHSISNVV